MKNKSENSYFKAFEKFKELIKINIKYVITDFEKALINSVRRSFENSESNGCFFHFAQNIWKKIGRIGLIESFKNNFNFKFFVKKMICLAFVPVEDVIEAWKMLKEKYKSILDSKVLELVEYFEKVYLNFHNILINEKKTIFMK